MYENSQSPTQTIVYEDLTCSSSTTTTSETINLHCDELLSDSSEDMIETVGGAIYVFADRFICDTNSNEQIDFDECIINDDESDYERAKKEEYVAITDELRMKPIGYIDPERYAQKE